MSTEFAPLDARLAGETLIEASAGTGKTHTITTLYVRLLLEQGLDVRQILVVTYTTAATAELRGKVRARLVAALRALESFNADAPAPADQDAQMWELAGRRAAQRDSDRERLLLALHGFDQAAIFTIHGFCERVLHDFAFESGADFDAELTTDQTALLEEVIADYWVRALSEAALPVVAALRGERQRLIGLAKKVVAQRDLTVLPDDVPSDVSVVVAADAAWQAAHAAAAALWQRDGAAVIARLSDPATGLNGNSYRPAKIRADWQPGLARVFTADSALALDKPTRQMLERCSTTKLAASVKKGFAPPTGPFFDACEQLMAADQGLQAAVAQRAVHLRVELAAYATRELARRKRLAGVRYFDDLLHGLADALNAPGPGAAALAQALRARFPAALVDEFQDTDPLQYDIVRRIYHGADDVSLFLIGDPKQAIYGFRGADVLAYLAAKRDIGAQSFTLRQSWRSDPRFLDAINALFGVSHPFVIDGIDYEDQRPAPTMRDRLGGGWPALQILFGRRADAAALNKTDANEVALLAAGNEVVQLLERGTIEGRAIRERDVAVLCRTNRQVKSMQAALRERGVAGVLQGDSSVFATAEADDLQRVLDALARPGDAAALRSALATPIGGLDAAALLALQDDERAWEQWVVRGHRWHERWQTRGITPALRSVFETCEVPGRLLAWVDGERRMTNLLHVAELLQRAAVEGRRGPLALAEWLGEMRSDAQGNGVVGEAAQIRLESDDDAVRLLTIHKSKGLEFPVVICPFVWDGGLLQEADRRYPHCHDPRDPSRRVIDVGSLDHAAHLTAATEEARAESLRLLYVALTRARHHCSLVWQVTRSADDSAFAYLAHRPAASAETAAIQVAVAAHLAASSDDGLRQDLQAMASRSGGAIAVRDIADDAPLRRAPRPVEAAALQARTARRRLDLRWRTSSFSGLVAAVGAPLPTPVEEGRDRDESAAVDVILPLDALHEFPGGARSGLMVHHLFEVLDDRVLGDAAALRTAVGATLQAYGIEPQWSAAVSRTLTDVLDTPLPGSAAPFTLRQVAAAHRLPEVEFIFPVAADDPANAALTATRLADVFAQHARGPLADYAARLRALPFAPLAGFLKGYIDLIFAHGGRWYLVDYKSNRLGARVDAYQPDRLLPVMAQHHYILQYHLYAVALHRYLQRRLPAYDYERDCGGAYYLFVRGMAPTLPAGSGIYHDRPPLVLIEALSDALGGPAREVR